MKEKYIIYECTAPPAGGLSDRFKGLVSCYGLAKTLGRKFIANWSYPYPLDTVLDCNLINWKKRPIQGSLLSYFAIDNESFLQNLQNDLLMLNFSHDIITIRTNINFLNMVSMETFSDLFNELFRLKVLPPYVTDNDTVGVCARFGGNLSNWNDSNFDRNLTFEQVLDKIKSYKGKKVFICTDSSKFLEFIRDELDFFTTKGETQHMDRQLCSKAGFEKSFNDFFLLRNCGTIISTKGEFAKTAALTVNKTVIEI